MVLSIWSVPEMNVGEDLRATAEATALSVRLRPDKVAPAESVLLDPRVPKKRNEVTISPDRRVVVMAVDEELATSFDLSLHDCDKKADGLINSRVAAAVDEQPHCQQIRLFRIDPLQLALDVAPNQHGPQEERDVPNSIAG